MEEERKIFVLLDQIPQPGFLVQEDRIFRVNQAAKAMLLAPEQAFSPMIITGREEYADFQEGQISLVLHIGERPQVAAVSRMGDADLVLLDCPEEWEEFRSMALVSAELRAPLMQAISSAQQLSGDNPAAAKMNQSLLQMLRLVSNLSDISRYRAGCRMELRDVDSFLLELFEKAQSLLAGRCRLSYTGLNQPLFSLMDPEQLERAVWNILSNCVKFTPQEGQIQCSLSRRGHLLRLTIQDNGSGIAEDVLANLFQRYQRQPSIEDNRYGLGLGLSMVRTVAANHGGTVLVHSDETGTRITMTLPIRQDTTTQLRSPVFRPDYTGGWDHGLVELSDCLSPQWYAQL